MSAAAASRAVAIVPLFDGAACIGACLRELLATTSATELEIVVVDDASRDESLAVAGRLAEASDGRIRVLALPRNLGFAGAVNRAVDAVAATLAPSSAIVLVNQDCVVSPGWLAPLVAALGDPAVAAAGARLLDVDGVTLQHAGGTIEASGLTKHLGRGCRDPRAFREPSDVEYACGALLALRLDAWRRIGCFDEGYAPAYFEDVDWCLRARRAGMRIVYVPRSEARHLEASTSRHDERVYLRRYHRGRMRLVAGHLFGWRWIAAELSWLLGRRRLAEIVPAFGAYPLLLRLLSLGCVAARRTPGRRVAAAEAVR